MDDESLISELREMVIDKNQIVTLKMFSQKYKLDYPTSKNIFDKVSNSENNQNEEIKLEMCYVLTGIVKETDTEVYRVVLSNSDKLESVKSKFSKLHSCSVFSIQRMTLKDSALIYTSSCVEQDENQQPISPLITNDSIHIRAPEISTVNSTQQTTVSKSDKPTVSKNDKSAFFKSDKPTVSKNDKPAASTNEKPTISKNDKPTVSKPKPAEKEKKESPTNKTAPSKSKKTGKKETNNKRNSQSSLASAFAKTQPKDPNKQSNSTKANKDETDNKEESFGKRKPDRDLLSSSSDEEEEIVRPIKKKTRIIKMADSESEEESPILVDEKKESSSVQTVDPSSDEEPIPKHLLDKSSDKDEDEENVIPPTPPPLPGKVMAFQTVAENYEDEDGFFVTKKVKKLVEVKEEVKAKVDAPTTKKSETNKQSAKILQQKKKQPSIASFFSKKS